MYETAADVYSRVMACILSDEETDAVPFLHQLGRDDTLLTRKARVILTVYDELPVPSDDTPWEAILDWRSDDDARKKLRRLRRWISTMARGDLKTGELQDEIGSAVDDYRVYMRAQHIKIPPGRFASVCSAGGDVAEELPRLKLSPLIRAVFRPVKLDAELMTQELKAPGRELAYLADSHEHFG